MREFMPEGSIRFDSVDEIISHYSGNASPLRRKIYVVIGLIFVVFALIGIWVPGWPTVSWSVPAAYLFSLSNEKLFRWTLTNRFFGKSLYKYYSTGKTLPKHAKTWIIIFIILMSTLSIWVTTAMGDPGWGQGFIAIVAVIGIWWIWFKVEHRY